MTHRHRVSRLNHTELSWRTDGEFKVVQLVNFSNHLLPCVTSRPLDVPYFSPMPDDTTSHKKQRVNKHTLLVTEGSTKGEVSKRTRMSGPTKQDVINELSKVNGKRINVVLLLSIQC